MMSGTMEPQAAVQGGCARLLRICVAGSECARHPSAVAQSSCSQFRAVQSEGTGLVQLLPSEVTLVRAQHIAKAPLAGRSSLALTADSAGKYL